MTINPDRLKLMLRTIDDALISTLGASSTFAEEPAVGVTVAITDPNRWERLDQDRVMVQGNIWVMHGALTYPEARYWGLWLSSQMRRAEHACQMAYNQLPASLKGQTISFVHLPDASFNSWNIEMSGKLQNAHQETPWIVQIRPGFEMGLNDPIY
jgi:hypothetical protein